jgi:hypothetical protein
MESYGERTSNAYSVRRAGDAVAVLFVLALLASVFGLAATERPSSAGSDRAPVAAAHVSSASRPAVAIGAAGVRLNAASDYFKCILGIGVPAAAAIIFVMYMTWQGFVIWMNTMASKANPGSPPGPLSWLQRQLVQRYAKPVAASCGRFIRS